MVWDCFSVCGTDKLHKTEGRMEQNILDLKDDDDDEMRVEHFSRTMISKLNCRERK